MAKTFVDTNSGNKITLERETKVLLLKSIHKTDYYKGKNHEAFRFVDNDGNSYVYDAAVNADMTEYETKFGSDLAFSENKYIKISAYFLPDTDIDNYYYIYNPRILNIEE